MLVTGGLPCAGWQTSAEARHDCCTKGACPDTLGEAAGHDDISQDAANRCCATSEQKNQQDGSQLAAAVFVVAPLVTVSRVPYTELLPVNSPHLDPVPPALPSAPLHVLLSVFLI
jgi:hypothetical protein